MADDPRNPIPGQAPRPEFAPSWLPRQQRCRINRQLHRLLQREVCSVCGSLFKHNSRTTSGLDTQGSVVVAGECCTSRVAVVFGWGLYSDRHYDFLLRRSSEPNIKATNEQIADAIAAYQKAIAETDKRLDDEAVAHALFDTAMRPADGETLRTLVKKYQANGAAS